MGPGLHREATCEALCYAAVGNLFSTSLHSVTIIPSAEFKTGVPVLGGGNSDKLMSNHTFNFGLFLRLCVILGYLDAYAVPIGVALFSYAMLCSRAHYTVDVVLAWWALSVVYAISPVSYAE
jgi:hypothetical protein